MAFLSSRAPFLAMMNESAVASGASAYVVAEHPSHASSAMLNTFSSHSISSGATNHFIPVTLPLDQIVRGLNEVQPARLSVYPSVLLLLTAEAKAGRLRISPKFISTSAEPLFPDVREAAEAVWNVPVCNLWGGSEVGFYAWSCGMGREMHLNEDLQIIEPVDEKGRSVGPGVEASKVYLTNLSNTTLPLIRYEVTDRVELIDEPCPCGYAYRRVNDIKGRLDDEFVYEGEPRTTIHPHVFRTSIGRFSSVVEYRVVQTRRGAEISIVVDGTVSTGEIEVEVSKALERAGLLGAEVSVSVVDGLERTKGGAKLKRFVSLTG